MVRRTDRPLGPVRVSFETTRLGPQHLIDSYEFLVPQVRHARQRTPHRKAQPREARTTTAKMRRGER
jgi:hypothetical protein